MRNLIPFGRQQGTVPGLWRETEFSPLASFGRQIDRLFNDVTGTPAFSRFGEFSGLMANWPSLDVKETDSEVTVIAEMPGLTEKDVELTVDNGILTLSGEKKDEKEERGYSERFYGKFERQIPVPSGVDKQHCEAEFRDGLLTIHLPKTREAAEAKKKIPINAETRH